MDKLLDIVGIFILVYTVEISTPFRILKVPGSILCRSSTHPSRFLVSLH
jgi:hypothetical protein